MKTIARLLFVVVLVSLPTNFAFSGEQTPIRDPENCRECSRDYFTNAGVCGEASEWGDPSNWLCQGKASRCWYGADGSFVCEPYCGDRCYSI